MQLCYYVGRFWDCWAFGFRSLVVAPRYVVVTFRPINNHYPIPLRQNLGRKWLVIDMVIRLLLSQEECAYSRENVVSCNSSYCLQILI